MKISFTVQYRLHIWAENTPDGDTVYRITGWVLSKGDISIEVVNRDNKKLIIPMSNVTDMILLITDIQKIKKKHMDLQYL